MKYRAFSILTLLVLLLVSVVPLAAQDATECEAGFRLFDHEMLATDPVCIPENPERVTLPEFIDVLPFLRADVNLVGASSIDGVLLPEFPNWEAELINIVDFSYPPNLEVLLSLEPDLIIVDNFIADEIDIDTFNEIAPTVVYNFPPQNQWKERASFYFDAVGELEAYNALVSEYEARIDELRSLIENPEDMEVSLVAADPEGTFRIYSQYSGGSSILEDIGFSRPEAQLLPVTYEEYLESSEPIMGWGNYLWRAISYERLDLADGDFIIIFGLRDSDSTLELVQENVLWQQLGAVQNGRFFVTSANFAGTDLASAHGVLDAVAEAFGVAEEFSPNPYTIKAPLPALETEAATACEDGLRPFVDVRGEPVCVPNVPQRIVAVHDINAGAQVLSLGVPLVGMASREDGFRADVARYFDLEGIVDVGGVYEPNLERILELQPDLIVHEGFDGQVFLIDDEVLSSLRAIAPVVAIDPFRPVEEVMADYQELLGDAATIALEDQQETFNNLLTDIEDVLGEDSENVTAGFVDAASDLTLQAWGPTALVPLDILTRIGVNWVPIQQEADLEENGGFLGGISLERINEFEADLLLVDVRFTPDILDNALYQQLSAVRAEQVIVFDEPFNGTHYPNYIATAELLLAGLTALEDIDPDLVDEPEVDENADS